MFISFLLFGIIALVILFLVIFGIIFLIVGLVGGASAAKYIKNKMVRKMMLIGVSIVSLTGLACILPAASLRFNWPGNLMWISVFILLAIIGNLIMLGLSTAERLENRTAHTILRIIFIILLIALLVITVGLLLVKAFIL